MIAVVSVQESVTVNVRPSNKYKIPICLEHRNKEKLVLLKQKYVNFKLWSATAPPVGTLTTQDTVGF